MTSKVIGTSLMILLLVMGALFSGIPIYATIEGGGSSDGGTESGGGSGDEGSEPEPEPETPTEPEPEPETPPTEPEPEAPIVPLPPVIDDRELPPCDGSPRDCITNDGNVCLEGQGGHECECEEDMSDCPNHPSLQHEPIHPCLLDPSDPVCPKPDPDQGCPEGYAQNEDGNCFLLHPDGCPSGYHGHEDDETGRCIPNSTPCDPGYEFNDDKTNCEKEHFTCDGKPSVVPCDDDKNKHKNKHKNIIIKHFHDTKIINKILESEEDLDVAQTIVAISYDEGAGINCVIMDNDDGQCETFDVNKDTGKEPLLAVIPFS